MVCLYGMEVITTMKTASELSYKFFLHIDNSENHGII